VLWFVFRDEECSYFIYCFFFFFFMGSFVDKSGMRFLGMD
jgi:hypothetical protein